MLYRKLGILQVGFASDTIIECISVNKTRSKGSVNLPQGFVGLTLICKDFYELSRNERNYILLPKEMNSQN